MLWEIGKIDDELIYEINCPAFKVTELTTAQRV